MSGSRKAKNKKNSLRNAALASVGFGLAGAGSMCLLSYMSGREDGPPDDIVKTLATQHIEQWGDVFLDRFGGFMDRFRPDALRKEAVKETAADTSPMAKVASKKKKNNKRKKKMKMKRKMKKMKMKKVDDEDEDEEKEKEKEEEDEEEGGEEEEEEEADDDEEEEEEADDDDHEEVNKDRESHGATVANKDKDHRGSGGIADSGGEREPALPSGLTAHERARLLLNNSNINICFLQKNPKRNGSKSHKRYEGYKAATHGREVLNLGGSFDDLVHDLKKKFIRIISPLVPNPLAVVTRPSRQLVTTGATSFDMDTDNLNGQAKSPSRIVKRRDLYVAVSATVDNKRLHGTHVSVS